MSQPNPTSERAEALDKYRFHYSGFTSDCCDADVSIVNNDGNYCRDCNDVCEAIAIEDTLIKN